ncbi:MAG: sulfurtransferase TusA family protein [Planctomycetota bacterium]
MRRAARGAGSALGRAESCDAIAWMMARDRFLPARTERLCRSLVQEEPPDADISGMERLDCRSLRCPMPIVQLSLAIRRVAVGDQIAIEACDAAFLPDLEAWSRMTGHVLVDVEDGATKRAVIRKAQ